MKIKSFYEYFRGGLQSSKLEFQADYNGYSGLSTTTSPFSWLLRLFGFGDGREDRLH